MKEQRKYLTEDELKRFLKGIESTRDRAQVRDDALREIEEEPDRILTEYKRGFGNGLGKTMLVEEMNLPNSPNPAAPNCPKPSTKPPKAPGVEEFGDSNERRRAGLRGLPMSKTISRQLGPGQPFRAGNRLPDRERDRWYSGVAAEELSNPIASAWKILGGSPMWCT